MNSKYIKSVKKLSFVIFVSMVLTGCGSDRSGSNIIVDENVKVELNVDIDVSKKLIEHIAFEEEVDNLIAYELPILRTGQIEIYRSRDDAYYEKGVDRSFVRDNDSQIVKDITTGLEWLDNSEVTNAKDFKDAGSYCISLELDGRGWSVPTIKELQTISYDGSRDSSINPIFKYVALGESKYWSITKFADLDYQDTLVWQINYHSGAVRTVYKSNNTTNMYVRCVRKIGG